MRKGFTMIELIFVIVILGILAAVAIPRLSATRDDAEISKAATNYSTLISDLTSYYTSQGEFAMGTGGGTGGGTPDWNTMTQTTSDGKIYVITDPCIAVTLDNAAGTITATPDTTKPKCAKLFEIPAMKNVFKAGTGTGALAPKVYNVGGRNVKF